MPDWLPRLIVGLGLVACAGGEGGAPGTSPAAAGASPGGAGASSNAGTSSSSGGGGGLAAGAPSGAPAAGAGESGGSSAGVGGSLGGSEDGGGGASASGSAGRPTVDCEGPTSELSPWPGGADVVTLEPESQFQANLSGLTYEPQTRSLWAVDNIPGTLFKLISSGAGFVTDAAGGWGSGKGLRYPGGSSAPDSEGLTFGADAGSVYVCAEHDNASASTSRQSVLRFDLGGAGATLVATHDWNLTGVLPAAGANTGIEAITWVPDAYLTARGFYDETKSRAYAPADYADHGSGLFLVGVEQSGRIYALALDHAQSKASLVSTIVTPNPGIMGLELDRDNEQLWFHCDETCGNQSGILDIDTTAGSPTRGRFIVVRRFQRPEGLPDSNHEGIAIGPESECQDGVKPFYWTDDADVDGFSLRRGSVRCGRWCKL